VPGTGGFVSFPSSAFPLIFYATVPPTATVGQTAQATIQLVYDWFPGGDLNVLNTFSPDLGCTSTVTVMVGTPPVVASGIVTVEGISCGSSKATSCPLYDIQKGGPSVRVKITLLGGSLGVPTGGVSLLDNSGVAHTMGLTNGSATFPSVSLSNFFGGTTIMEVDVLYTGNYAPGGYGTVVWVNCGTGREACPN